MYVKRLRGRGERILYLDFDGVLHPDGVYWHPKRGAYLRGAEGHRLFEHAPLLVELLAPYPDIRIVLSTSWVVRYGYSKAASHLPGDLRSRIIGATYHSAVPGDVHLGRPRGQQVFSDTLRRKPAAWLAVDDDHDEWPEVCRHHGLRTHNVSGIAEPSVLDACREAIDALAGRQSLYSSTPSAVVHRVLQALREQPAVHSDGDEASETQDAAHAEVSRVFQSLCSHLKTSLGQTEVWTAAAEPLVLGWFWSPQDELAGRTPQEVLQGFPLEVALTSIDALLAAWRRHG